MTKEKLESRKAWTKEKRQRKKNKIFRVSDSEFHAFNDNAKALNLTGGDFFRKLCCSSEPLRIKKIRKMDETLLAKILGQLGKWGSNLNQIAHSINIARKEPTYSSSYAAKRLDKYENDIAAMRDSIAEIELKIQKALM
jgi:Bacterial mobilisation protein (MobC).